jgi:hypothetical protein
VSGLTIEVTEPASASARWAEILGLPVTHDDGAATIRLEHAGQDLRFVAADPGRGEAIAEVRLSTGHAIPPVDVAGVRFVSTARAPAGGPA